MRIAFFTDSYLPNVDGVVSSIITYRKELEKRGHEVIIFCPGSKKQKTENKDDNIYYFTSASFKPYPDYRIALFPFFSAVKRAKERKIDIVHSHGIATTGIAAIQCSNKLHIPAVATFHTLIPEGVHYLTKHAKIQDFFKSVAWKYLKWYYSNFNPVIVPSVYIKKLLESHGVQHLAINPTGFNSSKFNKSVNGLGIRKKYKIGNSPLILHVGRIALEKKLEVLIESADNILNLYPKAKFMIVGKGPAKEHYEQMVESKGLSKNFIFTDYVRDSELPKYYSAANVLVFPSTFDTQGLVVLESLAVGTPAVVRKDSAPADFISEGSTGYTFSDHFDLPEKITSAIKNGKKLKQNALNESGKYTIKNSTDKLLEIYENALKKKV